MEQENTLKSAIEVNNIIVGNLIASSYVDKYGIADIDGLAIGYNENSNLIYLVLDYTIEHEEIYDYFSLVQDTSSNNMQLCISDSEYEKEVFTNPKILDKTENEIITFFKNAKTLEINENTSQITLDKLANDESLRVRDAAANNKNTSKTTSCTEKLTKLKIKD